MTWETALSRLQLAVIAAPDRVVTVFLSAAIPVGIAVAFRVFVPVVVIPAVIAAVIACWRWTPSGYLSGQPGAGRPGPVRARDAALGAGVALVLVAVWMWVNKGYTSQYVVLNRDPGIYTLRAMWLTDHASPVIDVHAAAVAASGVPGAEAGSLAFPAVGGTIYPQSNGLLPGLLAVAGWVGGLKALLKGNLVIGGVALLAVYGFARRLLGPLWALVPAVALAACMPMVAFSRSPYSEPVALAAGFGGLTLLWVAWESRRLSGFLLAGLLLGAASLARIDGGTTVIGILAGFGVVTLGARAASTRRFAARAATLFFLGSAILTGISLIDGARNSPIYLKSQAAEVVPLSVATVAAWLVVVGVAFIPLAPVRVWLARAGKPVGRGVAVVALLLGAVMISRPLWWTAEFTQGASQNAVKGMQISSGLPIDPARSYDESSVNWLAMYLGWVAVLLGAIGAAMLLARVIRRRDPRVAVFTMTVACVSLLYLNRVSIFPDQIWAMRRFLPVIIPGLLIAATYPLLVLARRRRPSVGWIPGVLAAVVVAGSVVPWGPVLTVGNSVGQVAEMDRACAAVANRPVIVAGQPVPRSAWFLPTFVIGCEVPTVAYPTVTQAGLAKIGTQFGAPQVAVVTFDPKALDWSTPVPEPISTITIADWEQPLQRVPKTAGTLTRSMWIGLLQPDGRVAALPSAQQ